MNAQRIAILGTCQIAPLVAVFRRLVPGAEVKGWHLGVSPDTDDEIEEVLKTSDLIISQIADGPEQRWSISRLSKAFPAVAYVPVFIFRGFHPDCVYLSTPSGLIREGLGDLHSGIIAGACALGLPDARVPKLFNSLVFSALGYFDAFETAKREASRTFLAAGYDQVLPFETWLSTSGAFMYTPNHPKICVAIEMAKLTAARMGLATADLNGLDIDDPLSKSVQWPVYPELARRIGINGSTTFVRAWTPTATTARDLFLPDFVKHCYERYSSIPREALRSAVPKPILAAMQKLIV